ncbi:hypothetical protein TRIP_D440223 [uncultured Paludibacter sp.]|uniref:Uncharacterized protein n=1 Tax=uncultured Paludibacter sp. TaxID=497635 RepID=A0A653AKH9_9BACT|nr:hypothetical protein TRIP_D440223 [uncultured Paludibacter sp.]
MRDYLGYICIIKITLNITIEMNTTLKISKSEVMKSAWAKFKRFTSKNFPEYNKPFSYYLKQSWIEWKNVIKNRMNAINQSQNTTVCVSMESEINFNINFYNSKCYKGD